MINMKLSQMLLAIAGITVCSAMPHPNNEPVGVQTWGSSSGLEDHLLWGCLWKDEAHTGQCCPWLAKEAELENGPLPSKHPFGCEVKEWNQALVWGEPVVPVRGMCCPTWAMVKAMPMVEGHGVYGETES